MPIYEFTCRGCGSDFEELVLSRSEAVACPGCDSAEVERQMSAFAIHGHRADGSSIAASGCAGCASGNCGSCSSGCNCSH